MSETSKPASAAYVSRTQVDYPSWIDAMMRGRWALLVVGVIFLWVFGENTWQGIGGYLATVVVMFLVPHVLYRIYRKRDPVKAEIVFHNDNDGYCSADSGDGDGDGGGD